MARGRWRRWRHPMDRGGPVPVTRHLLWTLLDGRFWRRHPAPFAKTRRGRLRRATRRFVRDQELYFLEEQV